MDKRFCQNCKFIKYFVSHKVFYGNGYYGCIAKKYSPFTPNENCERKNKDGYCKDYVPKWWKILYAISWIFEKEHRGPAQTETKN